VAQHIVQKLVKQLNLEKDITINTLEDFDRLFERGNLTKPLILIFDEFDALSEVAISSLVSVFRHIYN
jgi:Cdc6-like AAA superfamily ATPase